MTGATPGPAPASVPPVALIGLGEVGRVAAEDLSAAGISALSAWDTAFVDAASRAARNARELPGVTAAAGAGAAVAPAAVVISAVTAANDVAAAESVAAQLSPGAWFLDLNSASPASKCRAAEVIDAAGGRYVEAALMSPIHPHRLASPFLLGGPHAEAFLAEVGAGSLGLSGARVYSARVGVAAATKLCRSVLVKGLEALLTEALLAARGHGVDREVLASLSNILPGADWEAAGRYFISRSLLHGRRRSEEMLEAAQTVAGAGIEPLMARATASRQAWAARHGEALTGTARSGAAAAERELGDLLDTIRGTIGAQA